LQKNFTAKAAKRMRGYLIRLTREYTDGGMDSHAEEAGKNVRLIIGGVVINRNNILSCANGRSAVHVFMREAG